jgi:hypothetical protein
MATAAKAGPAWTLEFYEEDGREPVLDFLRGLDSVKERALIAALRNVLEYDGIGVCGSSWGKWVQGAPGIFEFRVRHDAATILRDRGLPVPAKLDTAHRDILLRVFCHAHGEKIVLLLAAYDKGGGAERQTPDRRDQASQATPYSVEGPSKDRQTSPEQVVTICGILHKRCGG